MTTDGASTLEYLELGCALRKKIRARERSLGTFVKTPSPGVIEVLAQVGFDFLVLDTEHAPFSTEARDACLLAGQATGTPILIRTQTPSPAEIGSALDQGALGVVVPRVSSQETAAQTASACRYRGGTRGFSPSTRAAGYGKLAPSTYRDLADDAVITIIQIEDEAGIGSLRAIAGVDPIDAHLIGPMDLAISLGCDTPRDEAVRQAADTIRSETLKAEKAVGIAVPDAQDLSSMQDAGISVFMLGTDQSLLKLGGQALLANVKQ